MANKKRTYLWSTIYNRLLTKGIKYNDVDVRYLGRWFKEYPECFPRFMLKNNFTVIFNWNLNRYEIFKTAV
jgi:hypothetical protein